MTVSLPVEWEQFVADLVAGGQYRSADEVVGAGLRLLKARQELRAAVAAGVEQADRGLVAPFSAADTLARVRAAKQAGGAE